MKSESSIRINMAIHPQKDPAIFEFLESISKEARSRRLLNLAYIGLLSERANAAYLPSSPAAHFDGPIATVYTNSKLDSDNDEDVVIDEEELDVIDSIFNPPS